MLSFGMITRDSLRKLSGKVAALLQAMDAVRHDTTPDHSKWVGAPAFARNHAAITIEYARLTGDTNVRYYDPDKLKGWADTVWPEQKAIFDTVYLHTITIKGQIEDMMTTDKTVKMYNLFVSALPEAWSGEPFQLQLSRCIREYTSPEIQARFERLDKEDIADLKALPCIFAYEIDCKKPPKFGYIRDIVSRQGEVRVEYEIIAVDPFLSAEDIASLSFELDIGKLELYRMHWAVKDVNLPRELRARGIVIPDAAFDVANAVDVSVYNFDVALSFPGEARDFVEKVAIELERRLGPNTYFYDNNYKSQLARPGLDTLLQGVYSRAKLDVVFLSSDYQTKNWCGIEFRAIKEIIFAREHSRVMFVRTDDGVVDGVFKTDGYIDARNHTPAQIADYIHERVRLNGQSRSFE